MEFPLSTHQERLWFIDHFERGQVYPDAPVYHNLPLVLAGKGSLGTSSAHGALQKVVARHDVLRTCLIEKGAETTTRIADTLEVTWVETTLPASTTALGVLDHLIAANAQPFALNAEPLLRAEFVRIRKDKEKRFWWLITLHHLIADRTSLHLLTAELAHELDGQAVASPELHYPDFVTWQRDLPEDAWEPLRFYWKWQLRGRIPPLELPTARPRVAVHTFSAARHEFEWDVATTSKLHQLASTQGTSFTAVALAVFKVLLHRYARQDEIVIGTSAPNRRQEGAEHLIGPVENLVVLRSTFDRNPPFHEFLGRFTLTHAGALEHQELPFDTLVRTLNPAKDMSRTALFDVLATCDETPPPHFTLSTGDTLQQVDLNLGHGKYDLALHLQATAGNSTAGTITYNTDLHDADFIAQFSQHFGRLALAVCLAPETGVDDLNLLDAEEEYFQLVTCNDTAAEAPREDTLISLFAAQVARTPDRPALSHAGVHLTYREVDARANQLAHHLRLQGVKPDQLVAVALGRSAELVIALLGVLKAGAAYLPVDPGHPVDRIRFTLEDAAAQHLVSDETIHTRIAPPKSVSAITLLDRDAAILAALPQTAPTIELTPDRLAYCIYTSGSTGQPKGALIEHRQVVRLLCNDRTSFDFGPADVWTLFHSCCFDFSVWEMYGALLFGGRLVIVPAEVAREPARFADLLAAEGVTVLNQTPSAFHQLTQELTHRSHPPLALRTVIFGGEALAPFHLQDFAHAYPTVALVNMFGITETTVHVTYHLLTSDDLATNRPIIGRPIPTTTTVLLDDQLRLVPMGVPGEICVGGEGVARGYLRRDELTREKFIAHPYRAGERLYRSGDLGRLQPDGNLLHLGRIDDQVQIRGFRVELGEIQTRLLQHPGVSAAEVMARSPKPPAIELVAYLVTSTELTTAELRRHLAAGLPDYMVPSTFVNLAALPLTTNGKVDRKALPEPTDATTAAGAVFSAPQSDTERFVAETFASLLTAREPVGRSHHFFEMGGHSLLAAQLISRVRQRFQIEVPLRHVFDAPIVAAFAAVIDGTQVKATPPDASAPIPRAARRAVDTSPLLSQS